MSVFGTPGGARGGGGGARTASNVFGSDEPDPKRVKANIEPDRDGRYDIGRPDREFRDIYISGKVYQDGVEIGTGVGNNIPSQTVMGNMGVDPANPAPVPIADLKEAMELDQVQNVALSTWPGSTNISYLGDVNFGTWSADVISPFKGGTGVDNGTNTITLGGKMVAGTEVGVGTNALQITPGSFAVAVGSNSGQTNAGYASTAIGPASGNSNSGAYSTSVGYYAGAGSCGANSVNLGAYAGNASQPANAISINATGVPLSAPATFSCVIKPIRDITVTSPRMLTYDTATGEIQTKSNVHIPDLGGTMATESFVTSRGYQTGYDVASALGNYVTKTGIEDVKNKRLEDITTKFFRSDDVTTEVTLSCANVSLDRTLTFPDSDGTIATAEQTASNLSSALSNYPTTSTVSSTYVAKTDVINSAHGGTGVVNSGTFTFNSDPVMTTYIRAGTRTGTGTQDDYSLVMGTDAARDGFVGWAAMVMGAETALNGVGSNTLVCGPYAAKNIPSADKPENAVALGAQAGYNKLHDRSIIINGTGYPLNTAQADSTFIAPIRDVTATSPTLLTYDSGTKEIQTKSNVTIPSAGGTLATQSYVTGLGYQTATDVSTTLGAYVTKTGAQDVEDKRFEDTSTKFFKSGDILKEVTLSCQGVTGNQTLSFPDSTGTIATEGYVTGKGYQTASDVTTALTGYATETFVTTRDYQTSTDVTNTITGMGYMTDVSANTLQNKLLRDDSCFIANNENTTRRIGFDCGSIPNDTTITLAAPTSGGVIATEGYVTGLGYQTASDVTTALGPYATREGAETITNKRLQDTTTKFYKTGADTIDVTMSCANVTTDQTLYFPDSTGTIATEGYVTGRGYQTAGDVSSALSGYATTTFVTTQGYQTATDVSNTLGAYVTKTGAQDVEDKRFEDTSTKFFKSGDILKEVTLSCQGVTGNQTLSFPDSTGTLATEGYVTGRGYQTASDVTTALGPYATRDGAESITNKRLQDTTTKFYKTGDITTDVTMSCANVTADQTMYFPDASGTIATQEYVTAQGYLSAIGGVLSGASGGTGVDNTGKTITISGPSGTDLTLTMAADSNVTIPSGYNTMATQAYVTSQNYVVGPTVAPGSGGTGVATNTGSLTFNGAINFAGDFIVDGGAGNDVTLHTSGPTTELTLPVGPGTIATQSYVTGLGYIKADTADTLTNKVIDTSLTTFKQAASSFTTTLNGSAVAANSILRFPNEADGVIATREHVTAQGYTTPTSTNTLENKLLKDSSVMFVDETVATKKLAFECATNIPPDTTRLLTAPSSDGVIATEGYVTGLGYQTAANVTSTLTSGNYMTDVSSHTVQNKLLRDDSCFIVDDGNTTRRLAFECGGITDNSTITLTAPPASGTIATQAYVTGQGYQTAADVTTTLAPYATQTFVTTQGYQTAANVTNTLTTGNYLTDVSAHTVQNKLLRDDSCFIVDDGNTTRRLAFDCSGISDSTTITLTPPATSGTIATQAYVTGLGYQTASDVTTALAPYATREGAEDIKNKRLEDTTTRFFKSVSPAIDVTLSCSSLTQDRILYFPNRSGTIALEDYVTTTNITGVLPSEKGGTGVDNGAGKYITIAGNLVTSGATGSDLTFALSGDSTVTIPETGATDMASRGWVNSQGYLAGPILSPDKGGTGTDNGTTALLADTQVRIGSRDTVGGWTVQAASAVAVGPEAGNSNQGIAATAVGNQAGKTGQKTFAVAVGNMAGFTNQGESATAIGYSAGYQNQSNYGMALGYNAGRDNQGLGACAFGTSAGEQSQLASACAFGDRAGYDNQGTAAVAMGYWAGNKLQSNYAVAVGERAGCFRMGDSAIAIGRKAGEGVDVENGGQHANSIIINASGEALNSAQASSCYIKPIRNIGGYPNITYPLIYNASTGEVRYTNNTYYEAAVTSFFYTADAGATFGLMRFDLTPLVGNVLLNVSVPRVSGTMQLLPEIINVTLADGSTTYTTTSQSNDIFILVTRTSTTTSTIYLPPITTVGQKVKITLRLGASMFHAHRTLIEVAPGSGNGISNISSASDDLYFRRLSTPHESWTFQAWSATSWYITAHDATLPMQTVVSDLSFGCTGDPAWEGTDNGITASVTERNYTWYRDGRRCYFFYNFYKQSGGTAGSGDYLIPSPIRYYGYLISSDSHPHFTFTTGDGAVYPGIQNGSLEYAASCVGSGTLGVSGARTPASLNVYDGSYMRLWGPTGFWRNGYYTFSSAVLSMTMSGWFEVSNWCRRL